MGVKLKTKNGELLIKGTINEDCAVKECYDKGIITRDSKLRKINGVGIKQPSEIQNLLNINKERVELEIEINEKKEERLHPLNSNMTRKEDSKIKSNHEKNLEISKDKEKRAEDNLELSESKISVDLPVKENQTEAQIESKVEYKKLETYNIDEVVETKERKIIENPIQLDNKVCDNKFDIQCVKMEGKLKLIFNIEKG